MNGLSIVHDHLTLCIVKARTHFGSTLYTMKVMQCLSPISISIPYKTFNWRLWILVLHSTSTAMAKFNDKYVKKVPLNCEALYDHKTELMWSRVL